MYSIPFLDVPPLNHAGGTVRLPGSKSISNRVLLLAALSDGVTEVVDLLDSDDTRVMLDALQTLGCGLERRPDGPLLVRGLGGQLPVQQATLFLGNAGTAMRPLTAALAILTALHGGAFELGGVARMHERPIGDLVDALRALGCAVDCPLREGYPPLRVGNGQRRALGLGTAIKVRGDVSSQFLTALLLALPLASTDQPIDIEVVGELISRPYIEITLNLLQRFGVNVQQDRWQRFTVPAGSRYRSPGRIAVEGDASSASYFIGLGAIAPPSSAQPDGITIDGIGLNSIQGDIRFVDAARQMGAVIEAKGDSLVIRRGAWPLKAIDIDCNHIPDAAMTLAVLALYADGPSTLRNIASWRVKETDRIAAMANECRKLGATVDEGADYIRIHPPASHSAWRPARIHTYDDHRVAMCFSLAAFNPAGLPVRIEDPRCVGKTFPDYFETYFSVCEAALHQIPVICIDGPTASGKGTLAAAVAEALGYHLLDSGALYRLVGLAADRAGLSTADQDIQNRDHAKRLGALAAGMQVNFTGRRVTLEGIDVTESLRSEAAGMAASRVSAVPEVRTALLSLQHGFRRLPGLVADGRDMGTVIFPHAPLKVYLTASAAKRAERRHKQLISKGITVNIDDLLADLMRRDARDTSRADAPLRPAEDALHLDNSTLSIDESVQMVLNWWQGKTAFSGTTT
ncbi:MAG: bifunctional 3-phosphoshikimate 1-carboxyvinyltransferase/cytidylate kinase [Hydrogenophaga sp.]